MFFFDAPGGTGKTYLFNAIVLAVRADGHITIATALSAIAFKLLEGVVVCLWVALATTVSRSRERLKKLSWVPPETLFTEGGTPLHSKLKVPIKIKKESMCSFTNIAGIIINLFIKANQLLIDEGPMGISSRLSAV